ncbi:hypothetical protein K435DRAFT_857490 [Dendrothele bispora CBS 962.96]|uniref:Uncharacterized protein n=1 Tax=Dendrothele bispora (strain CBS 962.96) TaxID=1314807 RepID=A0A4S8M5N5_DENBC|nr:hypothetical protein K435DRAFT_857490 [Dendrothele bispora CBS 962.96]
MQVKNGNDQTVLKYDQPVAPMLPDQEPKLVTTTVRDYDLSKVSKLLYSDHIGITMIAFLPGYMTFTQPLFTQPLMGLKSL